MQSTLQMLQLILDGNESARDISTNTSLVTSDSEASRSSLSMIRKGDCWEEPDLLPDDLAAMLDPCTIGCQCHCHEIVTWTINTACVLGRLMWCFKGRPYFNSLLRTCSCACNTCSVYEIAYTPPCWISAQTHTWPGPPNLTRTNAVPYWSEWMMAARHGHDDWLKSLYKECPSHINDVDPLGYDALAVS